MVVKCCLSESRFQFYYNFNEVFNIAPLLIFTVLNWKLSLRKVFSFRRMFASLSIFSQLKHFLLNGYFELFLIVESHTRAINFHRDAN